MKVSNIHHLLESKHLLQNRKNIQDASAIYVISSVAGEQNPRPKTVVFFSLIFSCFKAEILRAHKLFYSDRLMGSLFFGLIVFVCDLWFRWHVEKGAAWPEYWAGGAFLRCNFIHCYLHSFIKMLCRMEKRFVVYLASFLIYCDFFKMWSCFFNWPILTHNDCT